MSQVCPLCGGPVRRLTRVQAEVYLLPARLWSWRVATDRWRAARCDVCHAVQVVALRGSRPAACPRCECSSFVFADAVLSTAGLETVRHVCRRRSCRHSEVLSDQRPPADELPVPPRAAFGSTRCHGDGFGGDW